MDEAGAFIGLLRLCTKNKDLCRGTRLHDDIVRRGLLRKCADALITMYAKCGALAKGKELLDTHKSRDVFTWTAIIAGYAHKGQGQDALNYFHQMQREGLSPDAVTFSSILKACGSVGAAEVGRIIHDEIVQRDLLKTNIVLGNALIDMYAKFGTLAKARQVLDELPARNVISWNSLLAGYAQRGQGEEALDLFDAMQGEGLSPDAVTFTCVMKVCGNLGALERGEKFYYHIAKQGLLENNIVLGNAIVDMYAKCSALQKARQVLEQLPARDVISWNALIAGYAQQGEGEQALDCFQRMQDEGFSANAATFVSMLKACGSIGAVDRGERIHEEIAKQGMLGTNIALGTAIVDMYIKCGALSKAQEVIENLPVRDVISWNALMAGYAEKGQGEQALNCLEQLESEGLSPDAATFTFALKACASIGAAKKGEQIHDEAAKQGLLGNVVLSTALVEMYAKCGVLAKAREVLEELSVKNVITWSSLIAGYIEQNEGEEALNCFEEMQREGLPPDAVTFIHILKACGSIEAASKGEAIHSKIAKQGLLGNDVILGNALVDMYAKCGRLARARQVLQQLPIRNVVSWSALIAGYAGQGDGKQALDCFEQMQREGLSADAVTFLCILKACGNIGAADKGESIHEEISKQGLLKNNIVLGTTLVDMYAKCGALVKAQRVLEELPVQDVILWNVLIAGYAQRCEGARALECFGRMQSACVSPDAATISSLLNACSRSGLQEDAMKLFKDIGTKYNVKLNIEHCTCMVDLYGRTGQLGGAVGVIEIIPSSNVGAWSALLTACRKWGEVDVGRWAFDHAVRVDKHDAGIYVLMAEIYTAAGMQEDADKVALMRE